MRLDPAAGAGDQSAVADRKHHCVKTARPEQFHADGPRALGDRRVIVGQYAAWMRGRVGSGGLGGVIVGHAHRGAEAFHPCQPGGADARGDVHVYAHVPGTRACLRTAVNNR